MSEPTPAARVDFASLASHFRVLRTTPAWSAVEAAIVRLRSITPQGPKHATYDEDVVIVSEFDDLLRTGALRVGRALVCAAAIGSASGATARWERLTIGLNVLSRALRFGDLTDNDVSGTLERVLKDLHAELKLPADEPLGAGLVDASDLVAYEDQLRTALTDADTRLQIDGAALRGRAWGELYVRMRGWIGTGKDRPPHVAELLGAAARIGPSLLLPFSLPDATVIEWTRALTRAVQEPSANDVEGAPVWLAVAALHALGFREKPTRDPSPLIKRLFQHRSNADLADADLLVATGALRGPSGGRVVILVRRSDASVATDWKPSPDAAVIAPTAAEWELLAQRGGSAIEVEQLSFDAPVVFALELPMDSEKTEAQILRQIQQAKVAQVSTLFVYDRTPTGTPRTPHVVAPRSVADILDGYNRMRS